MDVRTTKLDLRVERSFETSDMPVGRFVNTKSVVSGTFAGELLGPFPGPVRHLALYGEVVLPWYRALVNRIRRVEGPTAAYLEGDFDITGPDQFGTYAFQTDRPVTIRALPDLSWSTAVRRLGRRLRFELLRPR